MYQYMFANLNIKLVLIHVYDNFLAINLLFIKKKKKREREVVLNKCLLNIMQVIFLKVVLNATKFAFEYCRCN